MSVRKAGKEFQKHAGNKWNDTGYRPSRLREVQYSEFPVVSPGGPVVGLGCTDFATEAAEVYRLAVNANLRLPKFIAAVSGNALVFGTEGSVPAFCLIAVILSLSGRAQIGISIVQAVTIDVIHEQMVGESSYLPMHEYLAMFSIFGFD